MKITRFINIIRLFCAASMLIAILSACAAPDAAPADPSGSGHDADETAETEQTCGTAPEAGVETPLISYAPPFYSIGYIGDAAGLLTSAPSAAKAGDIVELKTGVLYDGDIHIYAEDREIPKTHYDSDYWGYSFTMPDHDIRVTASFYTKGEVWGTDAAEESALREKYPAYYDLPTGKGLEVYVWQTAQDSYSCGVMEGTNREKTPEELMNLKGASVDEMNIILSGYDIPRENIFIIPWQNPVSSYISEYWIIGENEDPDSVSARRQEYIRRLREMLFGEKETGFYGSELCVRMGRQTVWYERYEAGSGSLTPKAVLDTFSEETEPEGIVWEVYAAEEYPDLSYVLVISGTNACWTYGKCAEQP